MSSDVEAAQKLELARNVNNIVRRCKAGDDGGFSYLCLRCLFICSGRKHLVKHLESEHSVVLQKFSSSFDNKENFETLLSKLVMVAPFVKRPVKALISPDVKIVPKDTIKVAASSTPSVNATTKCTPTASTPPAPLPPVNINVMKAIDARLKLHTNMGSIAGRIARQLGLIFKKKAEDDNSPSSCVCFRCSEAAGDDNKNTKNGSITNDDGLVELTGCKAVMQHLVEGHSQFLRDLEQMFPQAQKRLNAHIEKALSDHPFDLPSGQPSLISKPPTPQPSKQPSQALKRKSQSPSENVSPTKKPSVQEDDANWFNDKQRFREQALREKKILSKLTHGQLRKFVMVYLETLCTLPSLASLPLQQILEKTKIKESAVFLLDLMCLLHEKAVGYYATFNNKSTIPIRSFRIGHIFISDTQRKILVECGIQSLRVGMDSSSQQLTSSWTHPSHWKILIPPGRDLGSEWNKVEDSNLILGAYKHNFNLQDMIDNNSFGLQSKALDDKGETKASFRERFGYMVNLFIFKGKFNKEVGFTAGDLPPPPHVDLQAEPDLIDLEADDAGDANGSAGAINDNDIECIDLSDDDNEKDASSIQGEPKEIAAEEVTSHAVKLAIEATQMADSSQETCFCPKEDDNDVNARDKSPSEKSDQTDEALITEAASSPKTRSKRRNGHSAAFALSKDNKTVHPNEMPSPPKSSRQEIDEKETIHETVLDSIDDNATTVKELALVDDTEKDTSGSANVDESKADAFHVPDGDIGTAEIEQTDGAVCRDSYPTVDVDAAKGEVTDATVARGDTTGTADGDSDALEKAVHPVPPQRRGRRVTELANNSNNTPRDSGEETGDEEGPATLEEGPVTPVGSRGRGRGRTRGRGRGRGRAKKA